MNRVSGKILKDTLKHNLQHIASNITLYQITDYT